MQNAFIESFNGRFRDECLNDNVFESLAGGRRVIEQWRLDYNAKRPHQSLGYLSPNEFAKTQLSSMIALQLSLAYRLGQPQIPNDESDVSMKPFPIDGLPDNHNLSAISNSEVASRKAGVLIPQCAGLAIHGRWGVKGGKDRNVTLATFERPSAKIEIGGAHHAVEVFSDDGTVSRGMSRGPVTYAASSWGGPVVISRIHGFSTLQECDLATSSTVGSPNIRMDGVSRTRFGNSVI